jgi:FkbM family methyltransferase
MNHHGPRRKVLYKFIHGLGDAVQFTCVLQHLAKYQPEVEVHIAALIGKDSCFRGLCEQVYILGREPIEDSQFGAVMMPGWYENFSANPGTPHTKVCNFLREECGIEPELGLLRYQIRHTPEAMRAARDYLQSIAGEPDGKGIFPVVALHYEGNTSAERKNLSHELAGELCAEIIRRGYVPLILDWDGRSPLPDQTTIFNPGVHRGDLWGNTGTGDAGILAALITHCELMIGVDSGPLHVAGATDTPTLGVWTGHAPIQFFDLCPNVVHLVPEHWRTIPPHDRDENSQLFFRQQYRWDTYADLGASLLDCIRAATVPANGGARAAGHERLRRIGEFWIRAENAAQDMVIIRDIFEEDAYRTEVIAERIRAAQFAVDIGAHIGAFAARVHALNPDCKIICCECCPENIPALRRNVGAFATVVEAACSYERGPLKLMNSYSPNCRSTGGSTVLRAEEENPADRQYRAEPLERITTLEQLMWPWHFDHIDILKLDCEGSEFSILGNTPSLGRIAFILGEYHGRDRWEKLLADRFAGWDYGPQSEAGELGNFHLRNPFFRKEGPIGE